MKPEPRQPASVSLPFVFTPILDRCARRLVERLAGLEGRLQDGEETAWPEFTLTVNTLVALLGQLTPERRGALLTTAEMADRLRIKPKALLKRKKKGDIRPALQRGKLIRWRGDEVAR